MMLWEWPVCTFLVSLPSRARRIRGKVGQEEGKGAAGAVATEALAKCEMEGTRGRAQLRLLGPTGKASSIAPSGGCTYPELTPPGRSIDSPLGAGAPEAEICLFEIVQLR